MAEIRKGEGGILDEWQKDTRIAINRYIMDHQQYINQLLH